MELRSIKIYTPTPEAKKREEEREQLREEASKTYSKYLVNLTNLCFEKCCDTEKLYFSKKEDKCIDTCFIKSMETYHYALNKFNEINKGINYNISENYISNLNDLLN